MAVMVPASIERPEDIPRRGMTVLEVLVALSLFLIIATGVAKMFLRSTTRLERARHMLVATHLAADALAAYRRMPLELLWLQPAYRIEALTVAAAGRQVRIEHLCDAPCPDPTPDYPVYKRVIHVRRNQPRWGMIELRVALLWPLGPDRESTSTGALYDPSVDTFSSDSPRPTVELRTYVSEN